MNEHDEVISLIEENADTLYAPECSPFYSDGYATLHIDMTLMDDEDRRKVYKAEQLLREAGVGFDMGSGGGFRHWELDWSLSGALIQTRPLACLEHPEKVPIVGPVHWATYRTPHNGRVVSYPYCSSLCRSKANEHKAESDWELLLE